MRKKKENLEYRMYGLVPYNISPIQQGIQFGHAVVEYGLRKRLVKGYKQWTSKDKTFIILNGGTTNTSQLYLGTLNKHRETLLQNGIHIAEFHEPDLGDQLTAIVFIVDERVFNKTKYPDMIDGTDDWTLKLTPKESKQILFLRDFLKQFKLA
jgi:hypothetical protein